MVRSSRTLMRLSQGLVLVATGLAPLGSYVLAFQLFGVNVSLFRLVVLASLALALAIATKYLKSLTRPVSTLIFVALAWFVVGLIGLQWSPGVEAGLKSLATIAFGMAFLLLVWLLPCEWRHIGDALIAGWQVGFVVTSIVAIWEVVFMRHLPGLFVDTVPVSFLNNTRFAMATLGHPNDYGAYLLYVLATFLAGALFATSLRARVFQYVGAGLGIALLVMSGARLSMLGFIVELIVLTTALTRRLRRRVVMLTFPLVVIAYIMMVNWGSFGSGKLAELMAGFSNPGSLQSRLNLTLDGAYLSFQHFGLGVGPGGFEPSIASGAVPFYTFGAVNPHNFFAEIAAEYSVFSLAAFVLWLVGLLHLALRPVGDGSMTWPDAQRYRLILLLGLVAYPFAACEGSSYMASSINWLFLTSAAVLASSLRLVVKSKSPPHRQTASEEVSRQGAQLDHGD